MLTAAQRLANLEAGLISAQKRINRLATDTKLFDISQELETQIYNLHLQIETMKNQLDILEEVLDKVQAERNEQAQQTF